MLFTDAAPVAATRLTRDGYLALRFELRVAASSPTAAKRSSQIGIGRRS